MKRKIDSDVVPVEDQVKVQEDTKSSPLPKYGTQLYWERRYQSFFNYCKPVGQNEVDPEATSSMIATQQSSDEKDEPEPGHPWYFNYNELRPLLLPLVLGEPIDILDESSDEQRCIQESSKTVDDDTTAYAEDSEKSQKSQNSRPLRQEILEIGCGDVPLGVDLCRDIHLHYNNSTLKCPSTPNYHVVCFDYSESVIHHLLKKQESGSDTNISLNSVVKLEFRVHDARALPYANNVFSVIIDKGTIDARMSDEDNGCDDCIKMVHEAARLLVYDGYLFLVSHFNPSVPSGMVLLNDVIFPGLQMLDDDRVSWAIEIHGNFDDDVDIDGASEQSEGEVSENDEYGDEEELENDQGELCDDEFESGDNHDQHDEEKSENAGSSSQSLGPAVYIIKKQKALKGQQMAVTVEFQSH